MWRYLLPAAVLLAGVVNNLRQGESIDAGDPAAVGVNPTTETFHDVGAIADVSELEIVSIQTALERGCEPCQHCYVVVSVEEVRNYV